MARAGLPRGAVRAALVGAAGGRGGAALEAVGGDHANAVALDDTASWETGNTAQQTFSRSEAGSGSYILLGSGLGATLPSGDLGATLGGGSGSYAYTLQEGGNWHAGSVSQSETGTDRYRLLQGFDNVANSNGQPGHLHFSPFGAAFADPPPAINPFKLTPAEAKRLQDLNQGKANLGVLDRKYQVAENQWRAEAAQWKATIDDINAAARMIPGWIGGSALAGPYVAREFAITKRSNALDQVQRWVLARRDLRLQFEKLGKEARPLEEKERLSLWFEEAKRKRDMMNKK